MLTPWTVWTVCSMNATHSCECLPIPLSRVTLKKHFYLFNIVLDIEHSLWGLKKYCKCRGLKYIAHLFLVSCLTFDLTVWTSCKSLQCDLSKTSWWNIVKKLKQKISRVTCYILLGLLNNLDRLVKKKF